MVTTSHHIPRLGDALASPDAFSSRSHPPVHLLLEDRLVEQTEAHVLVRLLLLLFLLLRFGWLVSSSRASTASSRTRSRTTSAAGWHRGELGLSLGDQLN